MGVQLSVGARYCSKFPCIGVDRRANQPEREISDAVLQTRSNPTCEHSNKMKARASALK